MLCSQEEGLSYAKGTVAAGFRGSASTQQLPEVEGQLEKQRLPRISKTLVGALCRLQLLLFHSVVVARRHRYRATDALDLFPNTFEATFGPSWEPCPSRAASSALAREFRKHP